MSNYKGNSGRNRESVANEMKLKEGKIEDDLESNYSVSTQIIQ